MRGVGVPPHPTLSPKGARAYPFFLSPLPVGEGWVRALFFLFIPTSAFPAKAGIQTLSHSMIVRKPSSSDGGFEMRMTS